MRRGLAVAVAVLACGGATGEVIHFVRENRLVPSVSSKTEKAWKECEWCGSKISYERRYRRDAYANEWVEVTTEIPQLCRKCQGKQKSRERLAREEAHLDRKIEEREAKERVAEKRRQIRDWTADHKK